MLLLLVCVSQFSEEVRYRKREVLADFYLQSAFRKTSRRPQVSLRSTLLLVKHIIYFGTEVQQMTRLTATSFPRTQ
jgi:hypothetical protein